MMRRWVWIGLVWLLLAAPVVAQDFYGPVTLQNAATATGVGTALLSHRWPYQTIHVVITNTATVKCQGSVDGDTYETLATLTATGSCATEGAWQFIRAEITACTNCIVTAKGWLQR